MSGRAKYRKILPFGVAWHRPGSIGYDVFAARPGRAPLEKGSTR